MDTYGRTSRTLLDSAGTLSFLVTDTQIAGLTDFRESMATVVPDELMTWPESVRWA